MPELYYAQHRQYYKCLEYALRYKGHDAHV
jgi:hypothetical protein